MILNKYFINSKIKLDLNKPFETKYLGAGSEPLLITDLTPD